MGTENSRKRRGLPPAIQLKGGLDELRKLLEVAFGLVRVQEKVFVFCFLPQTSGYRKLDTVAVMTSSRPPA